MKKVIAGFLSVVTAASMMFGMTAMAEDQNALDRIKERGKLIMATDAAWPPFEYMEGEDVVGVDVEIGKAIAEGLGVDFEVINVAFDSLSMYLQDGEADIAIAAMTITEERQEVMEFSNPYCIACQNIIVKNDDEKVQCVDDLAGYVIGVHLGTTGDFLASDEVNMGVLAGTGASVQQYKDLTIASMGLSQGDVQAIICDRLLAENLCAENADLKTFEAVFADGTSSTEEYGVAANKGETELIEAINGVVDPLLADGTVDGLILEYSEKAATINDEAETE